MAKEKRIAVTLPAGPKLEQTVERIRWAEESIRVQPMERAGAATSGKREVILCGGAPGAAE